MPSRIERRGMLGWRIVRTLLIPYIVIVGLIVLFEDQFIYFPSKYPAGAWDVEKIIPAGEGPFPKIEDCRFTTKDGVDLHGWYCSPYQNRAGSLAPVAPTAVVPCFHGNAG